MRLNHSLKQIVTPFGSVRFELRVWGGVLNLKRRFVDKSEALIALADILRDKDALIERKKAGIPLSLTFGTEYRRWRQFRAEKDFSPGWIINIDTYWRELSERLESLPPDKVTPPFLKALEVSLLEGGNSQNTVNKKIGFVLAVLNFSIEMRSIKINPAAGYRLTRPPAKEMQFWERDEAISFLEFLSSKCPRGSASRWRYAACLMALNTGMRAGEIWGLRYRNVKREKSIIRVAEQYHRVSREFEVTKGKDARNVPLNSEVVSELDFSHAPDELVFSIDGAPIDHDAFSRNWFNTMVKRWGGRRIPFHGLRHTAATLMLGAGVNIKTLQAIMGHKSITTTFQYVHLIGADVENVARSFSLAPKADLRIVSSDTGK